MTAMDAGGALAAFAREVERPDGDIELAPAALALASMEYPALDPRPWLRRLDDLAEASGGSRAADPLTRLHRVREHLFGDLGFSGNREQYFDPRNSFLNEVLDRRKGIPISLSLVLIEVGRRVGLVMEGIGLPGHFVAACRVGGERILLDAFSGGRIITAEECADLVKRALGRRVELAGEHLAPVGNRQFLARMLRNLKGIYCQREDWSRLLAVIDRLLLVEPDSACERRDRGTALANLGDLRSAVGEWERYLQDHPDAPDFEQVLAQLRKQRQCLARMN